MRILGWTLLTVLFFWLMLTVFNSANRWQSWQPTKQMNWEQEFNTYPVFWLDGQQDITFNLPANAEQVRLMFTPSAELLIGQYSIDYQVLDNNGDIISEAQRTFSHNEDMAMLHDGQLPDRFFDHPSGLTAGLTSDFFIDNDSDNPIHSIKLKLSAPSGARVAARLSVLERKNERDLPVLWQRMRRDKRTQLLAENIYPPELVPEKQRRTVLKYSWLPVGPEGLAQQDYQSATVFIRKNILFKPDISASLSNPYMKANIDKVVSFINTPTLGATGFRCQPEEGKSLAWLAVLVQDQTLPEQIKSLRYSGEALQQIIPLSDMAAFYQITSASGCIVTLVDHQGKTIELEPQVQRIYRVNSEQPLSYSLVNMGQNMQPIKLTLRGLQLSNKTMTPIEVDWQVFSISDELLLTGKFILSKQTDNYERLVSHVKNNGDILLRASRHYIMAPPHAARLQLSTSGTVALINAATRPLTLPYTKEVGEDADFPQWFSLLPVNYNQLKANDGSRLLYSQPRPLEIDQTVQDLITQWQPLVSIEPQPTYSLFSGDPKGQFHPLTLSSQSLEFTRPDRNSIRPKLIYLRSSDKGTKKVTIKLDGKPYNYWLTAGAGKINLPEISVGSHQLEIQDADNNSWYIDQLQRPPTINNGRVRQTYKLQQSLSFSIDKSAAIEWLSFHYFPATNQPHQIQVSLEYNYPTGDDRAHTVPLRQFNIPASSQGSEGVLLNQSDTTLWPSYLLKFPLRQDLPLATYRLKLMSDRPGSGYIQASYIQDNMSHEFEHYTEVENAK
jgi:hypothetical protein